MNSMPALFAALSQAATGSLIAAIWQGILLAAAVALGFRLLPKTPAAVRFAVWFGVFVLVAMLPLIALLSHRLGDQQATGHTPLLTLNSRWPLAIAAVWLMASLFRVVTLLWAAWRVRELWKSATPIATAQASCPSEFPVIPTSTLRRAQVCTSGHIDRPTVIGFFSPRILIPIWLFEKLTPVEVEQIVLHESGHLSRADDWMNLLQKIAVVVFPLNPALAWVERRLCFERELACDERVLRATASPKAYASCLASVAEHRMGRRGLALALGILGRESELGQRVRRILHPRDAMRPQHAKLVLGGAMLGLLAAAVGVERCPQLVGFASTPCITIAADSPVPLAGGFAMQPVVFHESVHGNPLSGYASYPAAVPLKGNVSNHHLALRTAAERQPGQQQQIDEASGPMQMTVVTAWQQADGSRLVLTTVRTARPQVQTSGDAYDAQPQQQEIHPYAAVPVQGGWIVFQL